MNRRTSFLIAVSVGFLVTSAVLLYEGQFGPRLVEKLQPPHFPFRRADDALLRTTVERTREELRRPALRRQSSFPGLRVEGWLRGAWVADSADHWTRASLALGLLQAQAVGTNRLVEGALNTYRAELITPDGKWRTLLHSPEQAFAGWFLLAQVNLSPGLNPAVRQACDQLADFLINRYPRSASGTLPYSADHPDAMLVDTLGLVCPFLATYSRVTGQPAAAGLAIRQLLEFQQRAVDRETRLPWHAYQASSGRGYGILGWARGSGWHLIGLAETLAQLPPQHPDRPALQRALEEGLQAAVDRQRPDGLWGWCLTIPDAEPDTSGTAMILWAAARARQCGVEPSPVREAVAKGIAALPRNIDQHGRLTQSLAECQAVGHYPRVFGTFTFAQGFATSALALNLNSANHL